MRKNGFTLVELLAVIVLLAALIAFSYPKIVDVADKQNAKLDDSKRQLIENAAKDYVNSNINDFSQNIGDAHCISIETLEDENLIPVNINDVKKNYSYVRVVIGLNNKNSYTIVDECSVD